MAYGYRTGVYSNSMINAARGCSEKYRLRYVEKEKPSKESSYFSLGIAIHEVIERFYKSDVAGYCIEEDGFRQEQLYFLLNEVDKCFESLFDAEYVEKLRSYVGLRQTFIQDVMESGREKGKEYTRPTMTNLWKNEFAPKLMKIEEELHVDSKKYTHIFFEDPAPVIYRRARHCLRNFLKLHYERGEVAEIWTEYTPEGVIFDGESHTGTIDRIEVSDSGVITVSDYKTGVKDYTVSMLANDNQLLRYAWLIEQEWSTKVTTVEIWQLRSGKIQSYDLTQSDKDRYQRRLKYDMVGVVGGKYEPVFYIPAGLPYNDSCRRCDFRFGQCQFYEDIEPEKVFTYEEGYDN